MRSVVWATATVCLMSCAAPEVVCAQAPDRESVPPELFDALCGYFGPVSSRVTSGELPEGFPKELIPQHGHVVGGLAGPTTMVVFEVSDPVGAASAVERQARAAGWAPRAFRPSGFTSAEPYESNGPLCRDGRSLNVFSVPGSSVLLRVDLSDNPSCKGDGQATGVQQSRLPVFRAPDGTMMSGGGSMTGGWVMGGSGSVGGPSYEAASATMQSSSSAAELGAHFADEARRAGWRPTPVTQTPTLDVWTFEREGEAEAGSVALLTVFRIHDGEYFAQFEAGFGRGGVIVTAPSPTTPPQ